MLSIEFSVDRAANTVFGKDATVTFTTNGKHGLNNGGKSFHYSGDAVDLRTRGLTGKERSLWVNEINKNINDPNYQVVDEKNHLHIEYDDGSRKAPDPQNSTGSSCSFGVTE